MKIRKLLRMFSQMTNLLLRDLTLINFLPYQQNNWPSIHQGTRFMLQFVTSFMMYLPPRPIALEVLTQFSLAKTPL